MGRYTIIVAAIIVTLVVGFWWEVDERDSISTTVTQSGVRGPPMVAVALPERLSEDARIGKTTFDAKCAACHGTNAAGQEGVAPPLVHKIYEPGHHGDAAFLLAARIGVRAHHWRFGNMPPVEGVTDDDVKMIATYVRELQRTNGID